MLTNPEYYKRVGEYLGECCTLAVRSSEIPLCAGSKTPNESGVQYGYQGRTFLSVRNDIIPSVYPDLEAAYLILNSVGTFIQGSVLPKMSTSEFEQDKFSFSTIYNEDELLKMYLSTFINVILYKNYAVFIDIPAFIVYFNYYKGE